MKLSNIANLLESLGSPFSIIEKNEEMAVDRINLPLGVDSKERALSLWITLLEQKAIKTTTDFDDLKFPFRIEFCSTFPFSVENNALSQTANLLMLLNQYLDLPAFELRELEGLVVYRYVWLMNESVLNEQFFNTILGAFLLNFSLFGDMIENVASGQMSFNDLLLSIGELIKENQ